jgi:very-short-patch-repair endonuclease
VGRVDLAHRTLRIVIECDGFETHGGRDAFVRDLVRFTELVSAGWRPLRFTWEQVMFNPEWVLERVRDVLSIAEAADGARKKGQRRRGALTPAV